MASKPKTGSLYDQGETIRVAGLDTWVVRAGARGGTPILFLHGIPTSAYLYRDIMRAMMEEHDCIAFDWPGFGSSAKPRHADYSHRGRADHLGALLDAMGLDKVHLVAHDVGGPAGMLYAVEHPRRVAKLAILNTTIYKRDFRPPLPALAQFVPVVRELSRPFFNRAAFDFFFRKGLAQPQRIQRGVLDEHWRLATQGGGKLSVLETWAQMPEGGEAIETIRAKMKGFDHDVLVLFGADDPYLPPPNAERLAKAFPRAKLQLLPHVGHFLQEEAPEEVADRLLAFFAKD